MPGNMCLYPVWDHLLPPALAREGPQNEMVDQGYNNA